MNDNERKNYYLCVTGIFIWIFAWAILVCNEESSPLTPLWLSPPVMAAIIGWRIGVPDMSKEIIDDMPMAERNTDEFTKKLVSNDR